MVAGLTEPGPRCVGVQGECDAQGEVGVASQHKLLIKFHG